MDFKMTRITPYLFPKPGTTTKELAGDRCGQILYKPVAFGFSTVVTWQDSQLNPSSAGTDLLNFSVKTDKKEDVGKKQLKVNIESKLGTYKAF